MAKDSERAALRDRAIRMAKRKVRESVGWDSLLSQASASLEELDRVINILAKRLREWYELHNPEFSRSVQDHKRFAMSILEKNRVELLAEVGVAEQESMGADISADDLSQLRDIARAIAQLYALRDSTEKYVETLCKKHCANLNAVAGHSIAAKLIAKSGSLEALASKAGSRIQLLGAEKAMFRHLRTKARMPKYGVIFAHPLIAAARNNEKGKAARALADKIAIAARVDFFRGAFIGEKLRKELEARFDSAR